MSTLRVTAFIASQYDKAMQQPSYRFLLLLLGLPLHIIRLVVVLVQPSTTTVFTESERRRQELVDQEKKKQAFFKQEKSVQVTSQIVDARLKQELNGQNEGELLQRLRRDVSTFLTKPVGFTVGLVLALPMYVLLMIYANPYVKYIAERLLMMVYVVFGVTALVFTILYLSPFDPAINLLGEQASREQIDAFNRVYGLDQSYFTQLWQAVQGVWTFDLGQSFEGNEDVVQTIFRRFPVTLQLTLLSLILAIVIAVPAGIYAAVKRHSFYDQFFMFVALIGLSIPSFWLGLVMILQFSIQLGWLPATYSSTNNLSLLMPAIVLGTSLTAAVARMTRSSTLDVIQEDYMMLAKAKGLSGWTVIVKHAVPNALIPVVTIIGLQFGGMLGGAAVVEKVFNISGLGSYIVDKQFIPDIPAVLGGVIYIAIVISIINLLVDLLYAFLDPRIRAKMKEY